MGVSRDDIFRGVAGAQPATPGSYGEPPHGHRLPEATRLGRVRLQVGDLVRSLAFYEDVLGLRVAPRDASRATLSAHGDAAPIVELQERPGTRPAPPRGRLGLYHFAILLPDRASLGRFARHLGEIGEQAGSADHLVSEAFYLHDPDNLGIEVYSDRPRAAWRRVGRELMMATDPLDVDDLVRAAGDTPWRGMPAGATIGHVHLHVGDLTRAAEFYSEAVGFDRTVWHYPGALFFAAGGYHHHLGTNVWAGSGAVTPGDGEARLLDWELLLPSAEDVERVLGSIEAAGGGGAVERSAGAALVPDPWGTTLRILASQTSEAPGPQADPERS